MTGHIGANTMEAQRIEELTGKDAADFITDERYFYCDDDEYYDDDDDFCGEEECDD